MRRFEHYVMVMMDGEMANDLFLDMTRQEDVSIYYTKRNESSPIRQFIKKVHCSFKTNKFIELPGKDLWERSILNNVKPNSCYMFLSTSLVTISSRLLKKLRNNPNHPKLVLLLIDSLSANSYHLRYPSVRRTISNFKWDEVVSFDEADCKKYGYKYMGQHLYTKLSPQDVGLSDNHTVDYDLQYAGADKRGRNAIVYQIFKYLTDKNVKCKFTMMDNIANDYKYKIQPGLKIIHRGIPYRQILRDVMSTNVILEVMQGGQIQQTARYYEAVCYNKKLLTNNDYVKKLQFYNPEYMKIFHSLEDIDIDWLRDDSMKIDYHYDNEFSPVKILDIIDENVK